MQNNLDDEQDIIDLMADKVRFIHGRVGGPTMSQVPDPQNPIWEDWNAASERIWDMIWEKQVERGDPATYFEAEYGPPPYCIIGLDGEVLKDPWEVTDWQIQRESQRFEDRFGSNKL
eukprot:TRINITY_DN2586_c2_g1_i3.p2 TRINITY_DN2586_c2_g1~~TRINITY_DN2586_c2_g1_i3.p2  ORF type:complete len:117 (-),score=33.07 TRINITY_DN2586_c2_g1_i3:24-374(-)